MIFVELFLCFETAAALLRCCLLLQGGAAMGAAAASASPQRGSAGSGSLRGPLSGLAALRVARTAHAKALKTHSQPTLYHVGSGSSVL